MEHLKAPLSKPPTDSSPTLQAEAAIAARFLIGCYRIGDASDPETYIKAITAVLGTYPEDVIQAVVDPRSGLPATCKWLPNVAEVKEACEREMAPVYRQREWERQAEERRRLIEHEATPLAVRPTYEELQAKHGPNWGIHQDARGDGDRGSRPLPTIEQMCAEVGVSIEEFEAINAEGVKWQKLRAKA